MGASLLQTCLSTPVYLSKAHDVGITITTIHLNLFGIECQQSKSGGPMPDLAAAWLSDIDPRRRETRPSTGICPTDCPEISPQSRRLARGSTPAGRDPIRLSGCLEEVGDISGSRSRDAPWAPSLHCDDQRGWDGPTRSLSPLACSHPAVEQLR